MSEENGAASRQGASADATAATTAAIQQRLRASSYHALHDVQCEITGGALILRGCVPSFYVKQLAQEVVRKMDGAGVIVNELEVEDRSRSATGCQANGKEHVRQAEKQGGARTTHGCSDSDCG